MDIKHTGLIISDFCDVIVTLLELRCVQVCHRPLGNKSVTL